MFITSAPFSKSAAMMIRGRERIIFITHCKNNEPSEMTSDVAEKG
jgi:hypothetical protein